MKPDDRFKNESYEFWANIKLLNQRLGYFKKKTGFMIPTVKKIIKVFGDEGLDYSKLVTSDFKLTEYGQKIVSYMECRRDMLNDQAEPNLMNAVQAKTLFDQKRAELSPTCPLPMNKQKEDKKDYAFLTGLVNMIIENRKGEYDCDYDPRELTAITQNGYPVRTLSRRVDGAFPHIINPTAIWEIKEYYYTTTFGSRIADGVYETMLDGYELEEANDSLGVDVKHYLFVDAYLTWWDMGKSYLCRLVDIMHMGLVDEVIIGREVVTRLPELVEEWIEISNQDNQRDTTIPSIHPLPFKLGRYENADIIVGKNDHAFYIKYADDILDKCVMVPEHINPNNITLEQAIKLLKLND